MLSVKNIILNYDERRALTDVSFKLDDGEIIVLLGPNGAGKTSLIRALNGTVSVSSGQIFIEDRTLVQHTRREIARLIAVVAQENETRFPITVFEFVLNGRYARGRPFGWETADDLQAAGEALQQCDLRDYGHRLMNELSGGERQRVVLARALATGAKILLLDEPTANLDLAHQALMFRLIRDRCTHDGMSAIVITHDLNLASEFADKIILLDGGKIIAQGEPSEVLSNENASRVFGVEILLDKNPVSEKVRVTTIY